MNEEEIKEEEINMTWHSFPHLPEPGARIIAKLNGCKIGNYFDYTVREHEGLGHIEKWCYYEDFEEALRRKRNEKSS